MDGIVIKAESSPMKKTRKRGMNLSVCLYQFSISKTKMLTAISNSFDAAASASIEERRQYYDGLVVKNKDPICVIGAQTQ